MPEQQLAEVVAVRPALVWSDKPDHCFAAVGRMPFTLRRWSRDEGLPMYPRGKKRRVCWVVDEIVAFIKATGK